MIGLVRTGDIGIGTCSHGMDCCPHSYTIKMLSNSTRVFLDGVSKNVCTVQSTGVTTCPHCGAVGIIISGQQSVLINNQPVARRGDTFITPCGSGKMIDSSTTTFTI